MRIVLKAIACVAVIVPAFVGLLDSIELDGAGAGTGSMKKAIMYLGCAVVVLAIVGTA